MTRYISLILLISISLLSTALIAQEDNKVYAIVEEMPYLESCDSTQGDLNSKRSCSSTLLLKHLFSKIKLDSADVFKGNCCNSIVSFIITKEGKLENVKIIRSISENFDLRLIEILKSLPKWVPGKHKGKRVNVKITFPMKIKPNY